MRKERQNAGLSAADPVSDVSDVSASCMGKVFSPHIAQIYQTISETIWKNMCQKCSTDVLHFKQISTSAACYFGDFQVWYFLEAFHRKYASPIIMISDVILNRDCGLQDKLCNRDFFKFVSDFCSIIAA